MWTEFAMHVCHKHVGHDTPGPGNTSTQGIYHYWSKNPFGLLPVGASVMICDIEFNVKSSCVLLNDINAETGKQRPDRFYVELRTVHLHPETEPALAFEAWWRNNVPWHDSMNLPEYLLEHGWLKVL